MTRASHSDKTPPAFELKGSALTLIVLYLFDAARERLDAPLQAKLAASAGFFRNAPLLIDCSGLPAEGADPDLTALLEQLRHHGLVPVALRGGSTLLHERAVAAGLGLLPTLRGEATQRTEPAEGISTTAEIAPEPEPASPAPSGATGTKLVTRTIRSGQRVVAPEGDLIVFGAVNTGAEILALGNIHVYGALRGRALAGIRGDESARVCALQFHPELVAVAGEYLLHDELDPALLGAAVVVTRDGEKLKLETLGSFVPSVG